MDCLIKYLMDEYPDQEVKDYAIGLEQPEDYKVVKSLIIRKNEFESFSRVSMSGGLGRRNP